MKKTRRTIHKMISLALTILLIATVTVGTHASVWFSQESNVVGTGWNATNLDNLYFPNMAFCSKCGSLNKCANTPLFDMTYSAATNQLDKTHLIKSGCKITATAMALRNLSSYTTTAKYDIRTGQMSRLSADPFTVFMAANDWPTIIYNQTKTEACEFIQ